MVNTPQNIEASAMLKMGQKEYHCPPTIGNHSGNIPSQISINIISTTCP
jgi:hypothetical protein